MNSRYVKKRTYFKYIYINKYLTGHPPIFSEMVNNHFKVSNVTLHLPEYGQLFNIIDFDLNCI